MPLRTLGLRMHEFFDDIVPHPDGLDGEADLIHERAYVVRAYRKDDQTLVLRGAQSDLLSPETAQAMTQRGPKARLVEFPGVGHAPTLIADDQVETVDSFLLAPEAAPHEEPRSRAG